MADYSDAYKGTPAPTWDDVDKARRKGYELGYEAGYKDGMWDAQKLVPKRATPNSEPRCPNCEKLIFEGETHACL